MGHMRMSNLDQHGVGLRNQLFTVAVPTYNRSDTAIKAIKSLVNDRFVGEIYVFDDGSSSDHLEKLRALCEDYGNVHLCENIKNLGWAGNIKQALGVLAKAETEYVFLCESDMMLADGWGSIVNDAFCESAESVALSAMLHRNQLRPNRSAEFRKRCLDGGGVIKVLSDGTEILRDPFGSCYVEYPDEQLPVKMHNYKICYTSNSVGTIFFRSIFLKKFIDDIDQMLKYSHQGDAWLSWVCFSYNDFNPKSLMVLDPGIALTFGEDGLNGRMMLNNVRWIGKWWWRYMWSSELIRFWYYFRYVFECSCLFMFKKIIFYWRWLCR